ncbi:toll/interleukin-1 receptor domain-containing protein [Sorangium sp. So ce260]|uniref:TIR domain-containing protein n=1 Tax=Sorangium sp. So ce260 TaxID=3133291 RepID=UPI003F5DA402
MKRLKVIVCYAPEDDRWRKHLVSHLSVIAHENPVDIWDDTHVDPGEDRTSRIQAEISQAAIAILLVSSSFLGSELIRDTQLLTLLERSAKNSVTLYPIIVRSCVWDQVSWLSGRSVRPNGGKPLAQYAGAGRDQALTHISREIASIARRLGAPLMAAGRQQVRPKVKRADKVTGFAHYNETVEHHREVFILRARAVAAAMAMFNRNLHSMNAELHKMSDDDFARLAVSGRQRFINEATQNMRNLAKAIRLEMPALATSVDKCFGGMHKISQLLERQPVTRVELADSAAVLLDLRASFSAAGSSITEFRDSFFLLQDMSPSFRDARDSAIRILDRFVMKLSDAQHILGMTLARTTGLLTRMS